MNVLSVKDSIAMVQVSQKLYGEHFKDDILRELRNLLDETKIAEFMKKSSIISATKEMKVLSSYEKRDVLGFLFKLKKENVSRGDIEQASKMLAVSAQGIIKFCVEEISFGKVGMKLCSCGRFFPYLEAIEKECIACSLLSALDLGN